MGDQGTSASLASPESPNAMFISWPMGSRMSSTSPSGSTTVRFCPRRRAGSIAMPYLRGSRIATTPRSSPPSASTSSMRLVLAPPDPPGANIVADTSRSGAIQPGQAPHQDQRDRLREHHARVDPQFRHGANQRGRRAGERELGADREDVTGGRDDSDHQERLHLEAAAFQPGDNRPDQFEDDHDEERAAGDRTSS